jgi:hypothetical protein
MKDQSRPIGQVSDRRPKTAQAECLCYFFPEEGQEALASLLTVSEEWGETGRNLLVAIVSATG